MKTGLIEEIESLISQALNAKRLSEFDLLRSKLSDLLLLNLDEIVSTMKFAKASEMQLEANALALQLANEALERRISWIKSVKREMKKTFCKIWM